MIKYICDGCKKEVESQKDLWKVFYGARSYDIELCKTCKEKYDKLKGDLLTKYHKLYSDIEEQEKIEVEALIKEVADEQE